MSDDDSDTSPLMVIDVDATDDHPLHMQHGHATGDSKLGTDTAIKVDGDTDSSTDSDTDKKPMDAVEPEAEPEPVKPTRAQPRTQFLNGLRGIAALGVSHVHAGFLTDTTIAPTSVDVFFVLSAFLLTMLNEAKYLKLMKRRAGARDWAVTLLDYFVKRILRVYPLFAAVALALTCMPEDVRTRYYNLAHYNIDHWSAFDVLTFVHGHRYYLFWTMPIEITYYFIIPLFVGGICLLGRFKWIAIISLYAWVVHEGKHADRTGHEYFRPHLSTFVAGSLGAAVYGELSRWIQAHGPRFAPRRKWQQLLLSGLVRAFELVMVVSIFSDIFRGLFQRWFHRSLFPSQNPGVPFVSLPISAVIVVEVLAPSAISRALEWNALCYTGKVSFSMYLLHPFVNFLPFLQAMPAYDRFFVRLVLLYALSTVSYLVVERTTQRLATTIGKRLARFATPAK
jgi:peptidoglycan/LPS O-acetylase OafA/YrhL